MALSIFRKSLPKTNPTVSFGNPSIGFSPSSVISVSFKTYFEHSPILIATALAEYPVVVVRGHGIYAQGESLELAYKWVCSLEQSAKTAFLARQAGTFSDDHELTME